MSALALWCVRHRRTVVTVWIVALVATIALGRVVGTHYSDSFSLPGTESTHAFNLVKSVSPASAGDTEEIVFGATHGAKITDAPLRAAVLSTLNRLGALPNVAKLFGHAEIVSPFSGGPYVANPAQLSRDGTVAYALVTFNIVGQRATQPVAAHIVKVATSLSSRHLTIAEGGLIAQQANKPTIGGMGLGAAAAAIVLLLVFGSLFAALMPLISALVALGTATALIGMLTHAVKMPTFSPQLVILIGLGVGIDYALFIVSRHRQGLMEGKNTESAIVQAVNTSGRAVLFAGVIVCVALLGMFALGVSFLYGLAIAASIGVAFTMVAALTLLPALLGFVGPHILSRRQRRALKATGARDLTVGGSGFWDRWSQFIDRRPSVPAVIALALIGFLAAPFFSLHLGSSDAGNDPVGTTTRTAYDLVAHGFGPGYNGPLQIVARIPDAAAATAMAQVVATIAATPGVAHVAPPRLLPDPHGGSVELVNVISSSSPQSTSTGRLIDSLRQHVIPTALRSSAAHLTVYVGGVTAIFADFARVLGKKLPLFIGAVVLVSFLLLALVFRSLVIPLVSAIMNLLSIGAAFGILTAVFQWGWLGSFFGINKPGPIEAFLPVMMFSILFGLSMDYQVFLVTRMHEEWRRTGDNRTAIRVGLARTGKTITAAALIMIVVFGSFILGGERVIKEFGLGLAGGVLIDAIVIRMAIVPAVMFLCGRANWWFPKALDRSLPKFGLEHE